MNQIIEFLNTVGQTDKIKLQSKAEKIKSWSLSQDLLEERESSSKNSVYPSNTVNRI